MINFLNDIRNAENPISNNRKLINTIAILFLGIALVLSQNIWVIIPELSEPPVRTLGATIPENESHIFR